MSENAPKHAAWAGLLLMAFGLIGSAAHTAVDVLNKAFHWQPAAFFGFWIILGLALWWPLGIKNALGIVTDSARAGMAAWRGQTSEHQPPTPPPGPGV